MSAMADTATDWQREVLDLKAQGLTSAQIAEAVGKHAATVRKVIARAKDDGALTESGTAWPEGDGDGPDEPYPGQTTVDDFTDPLEEFRAEAGEAVGPMPPREMDGGEVVETAPFVKGTVQLALDFGPNAAPVAGATVVFRSEKLASGFFAMGDVVTGTFTARITGVAGSEKLDKDLGEFVAKPQAQTATITEIRIEASDD